MQFFLLCHIPNILFLYFERLFGIIRKCQNRLRSFKIIDERLPVMVSYFIRFVVGIGHFYWFTIIRSAAGPVARLNAT
jgi:hypothetical protein